MTYHKSFFNAIIIFKKILSLDILDSWIVIKWVFMDRFDCTVYQMIAFFITNTLETIFFTTILILLKKYQFYINVSDNNVEFGTA